MLALALLLAVAYVPLVPSSPTVGRWAVVAVLVPPLLLLRPPAAPLPRGAEWAGAVLLAWCAATLLWSASPLDTLGALVHLALLAMVAVLFRSASDADVRRFWAGLALGVTASLPFSAAQAMGYHPVQDLLSVFPGGSPGLFLTTDAMAEVAVVAGLGAVLSGMPWLALGPLACAALSGRREVALMLIAAGLAWLVHERRWHALAVVVPAVVIFGAIWLSDPGPLTSVVHRLAIWENVAVNLSWAGWGLGTFPAAFPDYGFAHSEPLTLLFELGAPAILLLAVTVHAIYHSPTAAERAALAALSASALVWQPLHNPATAVLFAALVGRGMAAAGRSERVQPGGRSAGGNRHADARADGAGALRPIEGGRSPLPAGPQSAARGGSLRAGLAGEVAI